MTLALYDEAIQHAARRATGSGSLDAPRSAATVDNPLCGDRVTMEVVTKKEFVSDIAHQVRGCLLCEAAACLIAELAPGVSVAECQRQHDVVVAYLNGEIPVLGATSASGDIAPGDIAPGWKELSIFTPAREHPSRHRCVLLPFEALAAALANRTEIQADPPLVSPSLS